MLYRMSLKRKIWLSFSVIIMLCVSATGFYAYTLSARIIEHNALEMSQNTLNKTAQVIDERLRHIIVTTSTFMMSEPFQRAMRAAESGQMGGYYQLLSALQTPFTQMRLTEPSIDSVYIYTPIGEFYPTDQARVADMAFKESAIYEEIGDKDSPWNVKWVIGREHELFIRKSNVITLIMKPLYSSYMRDSYVIVNIKEEAIIDLMAAEMMSRLVTAEGEQVLRMVRSRWELDYDQLLQSRTDLGKGNLELPSQGDTLLVNYATLEMNRDWVLVGAQSKGELLAPLRTLALSIVAIMVGCLLLALWFSHILSGILLRPLFKLRNLMQRVEQEQLDVRFNGPYEDEVGQVGHKFNQMLTRIEGLIAEVKHSENEKRKSEIKALQAQIDPHFLYNTLNTIFWKSELAEHETVQEMIVSLSQLFRLGLNNGYEITTLEQELEHVQQYLKLQSTCYSGLFEYEIELADPALKSLPILKILLQPLVENAIMHGFADRTQAGQIVIKVWRDNRSDHLVMAVSDNGAGLDVQEVWRKINDVSRNRQSYALANVQGRLKLYYAGDTHLLIASKPDVETTFTIRIPVNLLKEMSVNEGT